MTNILFPLPSAQEDAQRILRDAVEKFRPSRIFGMLSGGHDSITACHVASSHPLFAGVVHVNTQTGIPETRQHVDLVTSLQGWKLLEYTPPLPSWGREGETAYEAILRRCGFPGPAAHAVIYSQLKERCIRRFTREHKQGHGDQILCITGVRLAESRRRMGTAQEMSKEGSRVWCAPIINWQSGDKDAYMRAHGLPRNPVTEKLGISGECCCGCFACPGERARIELYYPDHAKTIARWEAIAEKAGRPCIWGERPPREGEAVVVDPRQMGLCFSCHMAHEKREAGLAHA